MISGRGSNLAAILELREEIDLRLVLSSKRDAYGLLRAKRAGVPTSIAPLVAGTKKLDWPAIDRELERARVTHLFLAGFMKVVPAEFVEKWAGRILNLHPSLLPAYPGLRSIERAHEDRAAIGITIHEVTAEVDAGRMILRRMTLAAGAAPPLADAEFLIHVDEQRAVKEAIRKWKSIAV